VQIGRISRFGLLEMSRQRLRPSLGESAHQTCPRCKGMGYIRSVESLALAVLRLVTEEARKDRTAKVIAQLPVDVANFLLNEKREQIRDLETRDGIQLLLVADPALQTPDFVLRRVRDDQVALPENSGVSYTLATAIQPKDLEAMEAGPAKPRAEGPAVVSVLPSAPAPAITPEPPEPAAPAAPPPPPPGVFVRLWNWLFAPGTATPTPEAAAGDDRSRDRRGDRDRGPDRGRDRDRGRGDRDRGRGRNDRHERGDRGERGDRAGRPERAADGSGGGERDRNRNPQQQPRRDERRTGAPERGDQRPPRPERGDRPPRPERSEQRQEPRPEPRQDQRAERPERSEAAGDAAASTPVNGVPEGITGEQRAAGPRGERGRRRRRGGRDRGDRPRDGEGGTPLNGGAPAREADAPDTFAEPPRTPDLPADRSAPMPPPPSPTTAVPMPPPTPAAASAPAQPSPPPLPVPPVVAAMPPPAAASPAPAPSAPASAPPPAPPAGAGPYIERGTDRLLPWESSPRPDKHVGGGEPGDGGPSAG
jgi:ribonuclease E